MRNFIDIIESTLPLYKGQIPSIRGSYGAFIVTMNPMDFLRLTVTDDNEMQRIMDKPFPIPDDEYAAMGLESSDRPGRFQMPYLNVEFPSGRIVGHEGRHRSLMVHRQGGKTIPVTIYPREDTRVYAKLTFWDWSGGDEERPDIIQRIEFPSHKEAQSHIDQLEAEKKAASDRGEYGDIVFARGKVEFEGSNKLKGAPARTTDPWEPARWTREDFPEQLVGQYNPTVVVPKSQIKIGLVKGYRHFKD